MAQMLSGLDLAKRLNRALKVRAQALPRPPGLAVVLVGDDPASAVYVGHKERVAERIGFAHWTHRLPASASTEQVLALVDSLNADDDVDGVLVQLPMPQGVDGQRVLDRIDAAKDVDGFHALNAGRLSQGRPSIVACTPFGVMRLIEETGVALSGKRAVVVGRSNIVGRPVAQLLEQANCTVTVCHSRTADLRAEVERAEILVVAIGRPEAIPGEWIRPGAVVIDVGMNRLPDGRLCGDVHTESAAERASAITPVPGGVGPMTIAMLMENTFTAASARQGA